MYMLIRYPVGIVLEAVVLAKGKNRLRVAAPGFPDVIELRRSGPRWLTAEGEPVEFDFVMCSAHEAGRTFTAEPVRLAMAAGSAAIRG
jgi:hypothetical protein